MDPYINQTITKILGNGKYELSNGLVVKIVYEGESTQRGSLGNLK